MADYSAYGSVKTELHPLIEKNLEPNDKLIWIGQPNPQGMIDRYGVYVMLSYVMFGACLLYGIPFMLHKYRMDDGTIVQAWTIPWMWLFMFACFAVPIIWRILIPIVARMKANETVYMLTDRRAVMIEPSRTREVKALTRMDVVTNKNGFKDFVLDALSSGLKPGDFRNAKWQQLIGFYAMRDDDQKVESMLKDTFQLENVGHHQLRK